MAESSTICRQQFVVGWGPREGRPTGSTCRDMTHMNTRGIDFLAQSGGFVDTMDVLNSNLQHDTSFGYNE